MLDVVRTNGNGGRADDGTVAQRVHAEAAVAPARDVGDVPPEGGVLRRCARSEPAAEATPPVVDGDLVGVARGDPDRSGVESDVVRSERRPDVAEKARPRRGAHVDDGNATLGVPQPDPKRTPGAVDRE